MSDNGNGYAEPDNLNAEDTGTETIDEPSGDPLAEVIAQRDDYFDQLQRSRAEFINYRKRTDAERLRLGEMFTGNTIARFLPIIDDWERAMAAVPADEREDSWFKGIQLIQGKFHQVLEQMGVESVGGVGSRFDPAVHESVATEPGSSGEIVVEVYQNGYKLGDTLLRAAMVKTGDATEDSPA